MVRFARYLSRSYAGALQHADSGSSFSQVTRSKPRLVGSNLGVSRTSTNTYTVYHGVYS